MRYAAFLRGINVGGNKKIAMAQLRELLTDLGYTEVATILQSGNAVFTSADTAPKDLADAIAAGIADRFGMTVKVMIRNGAELAAVLAGSPLPGEPENGSRFHVAFLAQAPARAEVRALEAESFDPDQLWIGEREAYLLLPDGMANTTLTYAFLEKRLKVAATVRNWNTVSKVAALAGS